MYRNLLLCLASALLLVFSWPSDGFPFLIFFAFYISPTIIIILRNPVNRAFSHYLHFIREGNIPRNLSFLEFIDLFHCKNNTNSYALDIVSNSLYYENLVNFIEC